MKYLKILARDDEFIAICIDRGEPPLGEPLTSRSDECINKLAGTIMWWWAEISQAEYETYQAFGITEIDLYQ